MARVLILLAVIFTLAMPAAVAFASSFAQNCDCPEMSHCADHDCGIDACSVAPSPLISHPSQTAAFHDAGTDVLFTANQPSLASFQPSLLSRPPCRN